MLKSNWSFRTTVHRALILVVAPLLLSVTTLAAHAQISQDFFQLMNSMGTGISAPIVNSYQQVPLSQALTMQPAPVRQPALFSSNYVNPFGPSGGLATGSAGTMPNMTCKNNICQLTPQPPPSVQNNQRTYSYQQNIYVPPSGSTFSVQAPQPFQPRRR
jgi:hypothetical protein